MAVVQTNGVAHDLDLTSLLRSQPYQFLQPTAQHQSAAIAAAKNVLDPLATSVAESQLRRRADNRRKRKRGNEDAEEPVLQLRQLYTDGMAVKQIWEQARRILDAACNEVEQSIALYHETQAVNTKSINGLGFEDKDSRDIGDVEEDEELESSDDGDLGTSDEEAESDLDDEMLDVEDGEDIEQDSDLDPDDDDRDEDNEQPSTTYVEDPNKLNDGFFSIDDFNKQSQFLEQMDARGDDDNPSDEDEIDWDANPLAQTSRSAKTSSLGNQRDQDEEPESDADGPTFGNVDLNGPDSDLESEGAGFEAGDLDDMMSGLVNTNEVRYAEFFEPPPKLPSKSRRMRALPKTQPPAQSTAPVKGNDEDDAELERAMADVRRDLFDSEGEADEDEDEDDASGLSEDEDDADALPRLSAAKLKDKNLSTHEKQKLQIAEEIRRLEAINVSKKPWTLSGEASAGARPLNSLIEEDLEFERTGKPVPVITAEVTTDMEALIKRRIIAREFDEVIRRRPTTLDSAADARRGRADIIVDDTKATTGLGEIYESEYQRNADPTSYVDKRSVAVKKQQGEIEKLWKEVRDQLDILSNLNVKPKRADVEITTVEDKPRIAMEDAQPAATGGIDENSAMLAPQEIYKPGTDTRAEKGQVLNAKSGASRSKEEMTREEKTRKRRREKERQKKAGQNVQPVVAGKDGKKVSKKAEQEQILKDLQKGGAKLIGKGGQLQEINPKNKKTELQASLSGGMLKL